MTTINDPPSILILRSTCAASNVGANEDNRLGSLPLWCDLTVMPEMDDSNHVSLHVQEQGLNPCGIDNVLLLQDLSPGQGYLMSLLNCYTLVGDDDNNDKVPVSTTPSTFFFDVPASPSVKESGVMINNKKSSTELQIVFDMHAAMKDHLGSDRYDEHADFSPPTSTTPLNATTCQHSPNNGDDILRVLEALAAREVEDVDFLLASLGTLFFILVGVYGWIAVSIVKKKDTQKKRGHKKMALSDLRSPGQSTTTTTCPHPSSIVFNERRSEADRPPIVDIIIDRSQVLVDSPRLVEDCHGASLTPSIQFNDQRTDEAHAPPIVDVIIDHSKQIVEAPSVTAEESDLVKLIRASPVFVKFSRASQKREPEVVAIKQPTFTPARARSQVVPAIPTKQPSRSALPPRVVTPKIEKENTSRDLSPCSRLAIDWEQKKTVRRNKRRNRATTTVTPHPHLVPVAVPEDVCAVMTENTPKPSSKDNNRKRIVPVSDNEGAQQTEEEQPDSAVPTSVSDGSFLNDYW